MTKDSCVTKQIDGKAVRVRNERYEYNLIHVYSYPAVVKLTALIANKSMQAQF
jgi:hypothetical protein